jgi:hypothetical protein
MLLIALAATTDDVYGHIVSQLGVLGVGVYYIQQYLISEGARLKYSIYELLTLCFIHYLKKI